MMSSKSSRFKTLTSANTWLIKNWRLVDKHAKASTRKLIGRDDVAKKSKSRRGKANSIEAKSRMVWTNGGFALVIDRGVWPKWLQNEPHVRITEVKRPAKKGASNAKA